MSIGKTKAIYCSLSMSMAMAMWMKKPNVIKHYLLFNNNIIEILFSWKQTKH